MPGGKKTLDGGLRRIGHKPVPIPVPDAKRQEKHNAMLARRAKNYLFGKGNFTIYNKGMNNYQKTKRTSRRVEVTDPDGATDPRSQAAKALGRALIGKMLLILERRRDVV